MAEVQDDIRWAHNAYLTVMSGWPMHDAMQVDPKHEAALRAVIDAATARALSTTTTEWGVRRRGDGAAYPATDRATALTLVARYPDVYTMPISRQVTEWREVTE